MEVKPMLETPGQATRGASFSEERRYRRGGWTDRESQDGRKAQGAATRAALLDAARGLFGTNGYGDTSIDAVVAAAGVTKGAVYHHFQSKEGLFAAVYEDVQIEVSDLVVAEFLRPDPWDALIVGCNLWIDAHLAPEVRRITLRDARAVLGWDKVREVEARFGAVPLRGVLRRAIRTGLIESHPLRPLALMIMGALSESCLYVADADDPDEARSEVRALVLLLVSGLRV
ncbi:MAG: TetR/AcrR family transcriptional regulator [Acidimicrobiales bacterium]